MSLKINGWRRFVKWGVYALLAILFLVYLIRVVSFENYYYSEKEGSERVVVESTEEEQELIEVEPTEAEVTEYTVAPNRPRYLSIEKLGVKNARILAIGVNANGELATPSNIFDVGWYDGSGLPGQGGTMIIDGHNGGPHVHGVFKNLPSLSHGDIIKIERGDGAVFNYKVVENVSIALEDSDAYMRTAATSPEPGRESISLISCTGEWSQTRKTYLSRQFTRAVLVE